MGTIYIDTGGAATNSGSTDSNTPDLSGTSDATVAGSVVTLTPLTDLTAVVTTAGATQSSIYIADATNTNRKIFWITAKADSGGATPNVTVDVAPTGVVASNWAIGGRVVLTNASQEGALRAGDEAVFNNSPASAAATRWTFRTAGDVTSGRAVIRGKDGTRPVLTTTNTSNVIVGGSLPLLNIRNLELDQDGASGNIIITTATGSVIEDVKISDGGGNGWQTGGAASFFRNEITGIGGDGLNVTGGVDQIFGNYIHDITGDGIELAGVNIYILHNIIDTCGARGINAAGAASAASTTLGLIINNTVYGCGNSGLEVADADTPLYLANNIFQDNGNAAGEYNVEWVAGDAQKVSWHNYNCYYKSSDNLLNLTPNATETTSDPLFADAANGDFSLDAGSPCLATGFPGQFLGGSLGYLDMGAVQAQAAAGGGLAANPLRGFIG